LVKRIFYFILRQRLKLKNMVILA